LYQSTVSVFKLISYGGHCTSLRYLYSN